MTNTFYIARLYVATFNRAADAEGLKYWAEDSGLTLDEIAMSFFDQPETQAVYPDTLANDLFVEKIYQNLFNRDGDADGITYWSEQLESGTVGRSTMILAFINGAQGEDALILEHKTGASLYYADCGLNNQELAHEAVQNIVVEVNSLQEAKNRIDGMDIEHINGLGILPSREMVEVKALLRGPNWKDSTVTYSFNESIPTEYTANNDLTDNWNSFDTQEREIVRDIFDRLGEELTITFEEVADGDIRFNKVDTNEGVSGFSYYPSYDDDPLGGDVFISNSYDEEGSNAPGSDAWLTIVHEIGHALGLKHPFEGAVQLPNNEDNTLYTIMTYTGKGITDIEFSYNSGHCSAHFPFNDSPDAFQLYDVMALQALYGANMKYASEADSYALSNLSKNGDYALIWDTGGNDTIDLSLTTGENHIMLQDGKLSSVDIDPVAAQIDEDIPYFVKHGCSEAEAREWVESIYSDPDVLQYLYTGEENLSIAQGVLVENLITGSGDDVIYDNSLDNIIKSGAGDDNIYLFEGGYDIVMGGIGEDKVHLEGSISNYLIRDLETDRWLVEEKGEAEVFVELWDVEEIIFTDETMFLA